MEEQGTEKKEEGKVVIRKKRRKKKHRRSFLSMLKRRGNLGNLYRYRFTINSFCNTHLKMVERMARGRRRDPSPSTLQIFMYPRRYSAASSGKVVLMYIPVPNSNPA